MSDATRLTAAQEATLTTLARTLVDQAAARVLVEPQRRATGFWFGGGNLSTGPDGTIWVTGRFRNAGDSRTGLAAGERGLECAVYASRDGGRSFTRVRGWSKQDLSCGPQRVLSIEGTALLWRADGGCELFVSSEKEMAYPEPVAGFRKPGTGVWTIDVLSGPGVMDLDAASLRPALPGPPPDPAQLHRKDPKVFTTEWGDTVLLFCNHPYCWTCSNTGYAVRRRGDAEFRIQSSQLVPRGRTWDVAVTRLTNRLSVPQVGEFARLPRVSLFFYDGAECVRSHEENAKAVRRPRGYSCEEIGGVLYGFDAEFPTLHRLSEWAPLFISPHGTGCSRYVDTLATPEGILTVWQQSQPDLSQPLVGHLVPHARVADVLG